MAEKSTLLEREKEEKENSKLDPKEKDSLEKDLDFDKDMGETWHTAGDKKSVNAEKDWEYIESGFDKDMKPFENESDKTLDYLGDIQEALSTWRTSLNDNYVVDDLLGHSQDVPSATAYGDLMRLIDESERKLTGWDTATQDLKSTLKRLKGTATRLNESMMKTAAECYSELDEDTTFRELIDIGKDPVSFKMRKTIVKQNKRTFERLNSYDDEIRGEKNMHEVIGAFLPQGAGDKWTTEEKEQCDEFVDDYVSKDIKRRRPHLEKMTSKMIDLSVSLDMLSPEYLSANAEKMGYILTQISYFLTVRNDPTNADYFRRLPEETQKKLDIIDKIGTSFTPGDFIGQIGQIRVRENMYRPSASDHERVDRFTRHGDVNSSMSAFAYDNKVYLEDYKRDRY